MLTNKSSKLIRPKTSSPKSSKKLFIDSDDLDFDINNDFLSKT